MKFQQAGTQTVPPEAVDPDLLLEAQDEYSPLLPKSLPRASVRNKRQEDEPEEAAAAQPQSSNGPHYHHILLVLCTMALLGDLSTSLQNRPEFALIQLAICRDHYRAHDPSVVGPPPGALVDEALCRVDEVQVAVANLRAQLSVVERVVRTSEIVPCHVR